MTPPKNAPPNAFWQGSEDDWQIMSKEVLEDLAKPDMINPGHYKVGGIETIDYLRAKLTPEEYVGYCRGNALKYISRAGHKDNTAQEIDKAIWYLKRWWETL
jgi:hypothetical protein